MAYSLFVSHASADVALAQRIFQKAHAADIRAYLFEHETRPGTAISSKIKQRIQDADVVVALLTKEGAAAPYETKSKWLWGLGGLAAGIFIVSQSRSGTTDEDE